MAKAKNLTEALKAAIRDSGLSHYRIAKNAGMQPAMVDRFMAGTRDLTLTSAAKIADALGMVLIPADASKPASKRQKS
jgi:plasmid maintenance system antidote protein VapI